MATALGTEDVMPLGDIARDNFNTSDPFGDRLDAEAPERSHPMRIDRPSLGTAQLTTNSLT